MTDNDKSLGAAMDLVGGKMGTTQRSPNARVVMRDAESPGACLGLCWKEGCCRHRDLHPGGNSVCVCVCARLVVMVVVMRNKETSLWDETWAVWKETEGLRLPWVRVAGEATS